MKWIERIHCGRQGELSTKCRVNVIAKNWNYGQRQKYGFRKDSLCFHYQIVWRSEQGVGCNLRDKSHSAEEEVKIRVGRSQTNCKAWSLKEPWLSRRALKTYRSTRPEGSGNVLYSQLIRNWGAWYKDKNHMIIWGDVENNVCQSLTALLMKSPIEFRNIKKKTL